jgi:hypothetical protein
VGRNVGGFPKIDMENVKLAGQESSSRLWRRIVAAGESSNSSSETDARHSGLKGEKTDARHPESFILLVSSRGQDVIGGEAVALGTTGRSSRARPSVEMF